VLLMCRDATVKYAWSVHEPVARTAGLTDETIDAIRARKRPNFRRNDEALIYDVVTELQATKTLGAATFDRATSVLGRDGLIETVSCVGFYGLIGLVLNVFDIPPQPGAPVLT
jgi:4-carboxymuconolactone decarboxylase